MQQLFQLSELQRQRKRPYLEFLRLPEMSAGIYVLPAGATDQQRPHREAEIYYVLSGRARMQLGEQDVAVAAGQIFFVPAHQEHRFHSITEELTLLVVFAPAETV
jgi:mannose-6-phosphate isomerase-like protein (cupin superfamily)